MYLQLFRTLAAVGLLSGSQAVAGDPWEEMFEHPLVMWALEIGEAKTLPWGDARSWNALAPGYDLERVVPDTFALLESGTPVLARMETMRRAIAYSQRDPRIAYRLLAGLSAKVRDAERAGKPDVMAWFDLGYFYEACHQAKWLRDELLGDLNGYSLVMKAMRIGGKTLPGALEIEFAAGLMLLEPVGQHPYYPHFKTVVKETVEGSLLEKNLLLHLTEKFEAKTLAEMRASRYLIR
jgi:hypothetical protein